MNLLRLFKKAPPPPEPEGPVHYRRIVATLHRQLEVLEGENQALAEMVLEARHRNGILEGRLRVWVATGKEAE